MLLTPLRMKRTNKWTTYPQSSSNVITSSITALPSACNCWQTVGSTPADWQNVQLLYAPLASMAKQPGAHGAPSPANNPPDGCVSTTPDEVVSLDQLVCHTAGMVAKMAGHHPTHNRHKVITVFVDQATGFSYIHFQTTTKAEETSQGKELFERYAAPIGHMSITIMRTMGIFTSKAWRSHCISKHQGLSLTGVRSTPSEWCSRYQIKILQDQARNMLTHAAKTWPQALTANLWPHAIRMANQSSNKTPKPSLQGWKDSVTSLCWLHSHN